MQSSNFVIVSYFIFVLSLRCGLFFDLEETCYYGGEAQERLEKINKEKRKCGL
jgi:hypothetical protein